jgi:hypothetical protein
VRIGGRSRDRLERQRARLKAEGYEPATQSDPADRHVQVRCFVDGALIAELPMGTRYRLLAPDDVPENHPDATGVVFLQCRRCKEKRVLIQHPIGPPGKPDTNGKR